MAKELPSDWLRSNVLGLVAIFIALGGTAVATQVASNDGASSSAKKVKVKRGPPGPQGPIGPQGPQGPQGLQGLTGPSTGPAGGDLSGTYPNPVIGAGKVTPDKLNDFPAVRATVPRDEVGGGCDFDTFVTSGVPRTLPFSDEAYDTNSMHLEDPIDCQFPQRANVSIPIDGIYALSAGVLWPPSGAGTRYLGIQLGDGFTLVADERAGNGATGAGSTLQSVSTEYALEQGEVVQVLVNQTSGSTVNINGEDSRNFLSAVWVAPHP